MEDSKKRTERKSQGLRSGLQSIRDNLAAPQPKSSPRIVDMSWAAEYLDDDWENSYTAEGNYDTKVSGPAAEKKTREADGKSGAGNAENDPMSKTQEFKAPDVSETMSRTQRIEKTETSEAPEEDEDIVKIRDAYTDKTIVSVTDAQNVRDAASLLDIEGDARDAVKIRDAFTDKTIVSVTDAQNVRDAASQLGIEDDFDETVKIRDALTDKTIVSAVEVQQVRSAASILGIEDDFDGSVKLRDALTDQTLHEPKPEPQKAASRIAFPKKTTGKSDKAADETLKQTVREPGKKISEKTASKSANEEIVPADAEMPAEPEEAVSVEKTTVLPSLLRSRKGRSDKERDTLSRKEHRRKGQEEIAEEPRRNRDNRREDYRDYEDDPRDRYRDYRDDRYDDYRDDHYVDYRNDRRVPIYREREYYEDYEPAKSPLRFIPLVLVIALCVLGFIAAKEICYDVPINANDYSKVSYTVNAGLTDEALAQDLENLGLIENPLIFRLRCIFYSAKYVEGTYELSPCYSTEKIINILSGYQYGTDD